METFELRYFVAVTRHQNMQVAAREIHISPPSLSKAVSRLESELGVALIEPIGRGIRLTAAGQLLLQRAQKILELEAETRSEISGTINAPRLIIGGRELLIAHFGYELINHVLKKYPAARVELVVTPSDESGWEHLANGSFSALLSFQNGLAGYASRILADSTFVTCISSKHALAKQAAENASIPIQEVLKHAFAVLGEGFLGRDLRGGN